MNNLHAMVLLSVLWLQIFHMYLLVLQLKFAVNDIQKFSQVHVKISVPKGIKFVGHPGKHHLTRKKCVAPGEAKPTSIVLSFNELGLSNITGSIEIKTACCLKEFYKCFFLFLFQKKILISLVPQSGIIHSACCFSTSYGSWKQIL